MPEEWIVRVQGKEYGPVDADELRAWRDDGRLIRENEVRATESDRWFRAAELPEVFADAPPPHRPIAGVRRKSLGEMFGAAWQVYRRGFWRFFALSALVSAPIALLQIAAPFLHPPDATTTVPVTIGWAAVAFFLLAFLIVVWPFSLAGLQLLAADLLAGRESSLRDLLQRAKPLWTRLFSLGLIVYGSYFIWTMIPLLLAASLVSSGGSAFVVLLLLIFATYMIARLFINFLFWQQAGALGGAETMGALRESKELARSGTSLPRWERPLWRGALIASLWLVIFLVVNIAVELPVVLWRLRGVTEAEQALPLLQEMAKSTAFDWTGALSTLAGSLIGALLRGWLVATFVVLYLDTKAAASVERSARTG